MIIILGNEIYKSANCGLTKLLQGTPQIANVLEVFQSKLVFQIVTYPPNADARPIPVSCTREDGFVLFKGYLNDYKMDYIENQVMTTITCTDYSRHLRYKPIKGKFKDTFENLVITFLDLAGASIFNPVTYDVSFVNDPFTNLLTSVKNIRLELPLDYEYLDVALTKLCSIVSCKYRISATTGNLIIYQNNKLIDNPYTLSISNLLGNCGIDKKPETLSYNNQFNPVNKVTIIGRNGEVLADTAQPFSISGSQGAEIPKGAKQTDYHVIPDMTTFVTSAKVIYYDPENNCPALNADPPDVTGDAVVDFEGGGFQDISTVRTQLGTASEGDSHREGTAEWFYDFSNPDYSGHTIQVLGSVRFAWNIANPVGVDSASASFSATITANGVIQVFTKFVNTGEVNFIDIPFFLESSIYAGSALIVNAQMSVDVTPDGNGDFTAVNSSCAVSLTPYCEAVFLRSFPKLEWIEETGDVFVDDIGAENDASASISLSNLSFGSPQDKSGTAKAHFVGTLDPSITIPSGSQYVLQFQLISVSGFSYQASGTASGYIHFDLDGDSQTIINISSTDADAMGSFPAVVDYEPRVVSTQPASYDISSPPNDFLCNFSAHMEGDTGTSASASIQVFAVLYIILP